ncbi:MAG: RNA polymerase sigma factor [Arachnia sp.]
MSKRDEARFTDLYHESVSRVYAYLRRHAAPDEAEPILTEVYLRAWQHVGELDPPALGWLITTARRLIIDQQRASSRRERLSGDVFALVRSDSGPDPAEAAVSRTAAKSALRQLPEIDREALLLVAWEGLTHDEAAEVLGCTRGAFTARIRRAREHVAALLDPPFVDTATDRSTHV